ncbi:MAG TPA: short-chain dehydrogenase [Anaerolineaceae bacterium]|nr:short-chain dehydrogenase [Anaerolineaceae bacterium]
MKNFENKTALITGGSSGIGLAVAEKLVALGTNVWILARRQNTLQSASQELEKVKLHKDQRIITIQADVSDYSALKIALEKAIAQYGAPDLLVNSAGIAHPGEFISLDHQVYDDVIRINYLGTVFTTKIVAPYMVERKQGYIVNISSLAGVVPIYGYSAYAPSKYAVNAFSSILKTELAVYNIKISVVYPPDTDTPQLEFENTIKPAITKAITESGGLLSASAVADTIINGIKKEKFSIVPGTEGKLLKAFSSIVGRVLHNSAVRKAKSK